MRLLKSKNTPLFALIFRILGFLTGATAITLQFVTNKIVGKGFMANHVLAYFTLQTNIITTAVFLALIIKTAVVSIKGKELKVVDINKSIHLATTFYITITMTVYWAVLAPMLGVGDGALTVFNCLFLHLFTPLFAIVDCLLFLEHGGLKKVETFKWLAYPVFYLFLIVMIAIFSDVPYYQFPMNGVNIPLKFPYPFIDPQVVGIWGTIGVSIALCGICILFGLLYIVVDNKIGKAIEKRNLNLENK